MPPHLLGAAQFFETLKKFMPVPKIPKSGFLQKSTRTQKSPKVDFSWFLDCSRRLSDRKIPKKALIDCRALLFLTPKGVSKPPPGPPSGTPKMSCFINYMVSDRRRPTFWHFETQFDVHKSVSTLQNPKIQFQNPLGRKLTDPLKIDKSQNFNLEMPNSYHGWRHGFLTSDPKISLFHVFGPLRTPNFDLPMWDQQVYWGFDIRKNIVPIENQ